MTNKEALEILKTEWDINAEIFDTNFHEALNLAIKALEESPQGDLISREALKAEFKRSANSVRNWKIGALNSGNDESAIRADAVLAYLTEVKGIIDNAPIVEVTNGTPCKWKREEIEYAIETSACTFHNGKTYYEKEDLMKSIEELGLFEDKEV